MATTADFELSPPPRPPSRVLRAGDFPEGPPLGPSVCGIDEAGRGPLAGPVYAAAVVLPEGFPQGRLGDSKALSEKRREEAFGLILEGALAWAIDWASPAEIDELNILNASLLAMERAYQGLARRLGSGAAGSGAAGSVQAGSGAAGSRAAGRGLGAGPSLRCYVDGNRLPRLPGEAWAVIKGDGLLPAIMAASILAKVARDRAMERLDWLYPEYGYARHKGYPTAAHRELCARLGPSPAQRLSFRYRS